MGGEGRAPISREPRGFLKPFPGRDGRLCRKGAAATGAPRVPPRVPLPTHDTPGARRDQTAKPPARQPLGSPGQAGDGALRSRPPGRLQVPQPPPPRPGRLGLGAGRGVRTSALGPPTPRAPHGGGSARYTPVLGLAGSPAAPRTPALERGREDKGTEEVLPAEGTLLSAGFKSAASLKQIL
ncbi:uncharacterized protein LOC144304846 isoform X1 [Canis aureus]